jgi:nucleoside-diphosphate-sugar epimerase
MAKRVLVTGGTGFIGQAVVKNLIEKGHEVMVVDRLGHPDRWVKGAEYIMGDVRDRKLVQEAVYMCDGVIHLAAVLGTQETIKEAWKAAENNILGSLNVFDAIRELKRKAVYIAVGNHWMNNPYSITKTCAERFAFMYNKEFETEIAVVRGLNVYGPGQKAWPVKKVIPNFIMPALKDKTIEIYGSGEQVMDMIYIDDMAEVLVRALLKMHGLYHRVFEAGWGLYTTVNETAELVIKLVGKGKIRHVPMRPGEEENSVVKADPDALKFLDLYPMDDFVPLREGLKRTIESYR